MTNEGFGFAQTSLSELLEQIAANQPVPGGGAVAGFVTSLAAGLGGMVISYSLGKKSLADSQEMLQSAGERLAELRAQSLEQAEGDAKAYERLNALWSLQKDDPKRVEGFQNAVLGAIEAPGAIMETANEILGILQQLPGRSAKHLTSDLAIAVELAATGGRAAERNVSVNLPFIDDEHQRQKIDATYGTLGEKIDAQARDTIELLS